MHTEPTKPSGQPPDIVFITTDTQGRAMCSCYLDEPRRGVETPHIDRFASTAVRFDAAYTVSPLCTPARSSWYTGLMPSQHGAVANHEPLAQGVPLLAEDLAAAGYRCAHFGKWHVGASHYYRGRPEGGFPADGWYGFAEFFDEVGRDGPNRFGGWNRGLDDIEDCFAHRVADRAIASMKNRPGDAPLFLAIDFDEPHGPYICPPPFRGRFPQEDVYRPPTLNAAMTGKPRLQREYREWLEQPPGRPGELPGYYHRYFDCNSYVDHEIGRVLDAVDRHLGRNAVVVFTSDHGDHLGAFGLCAKGPTMYDHTTRVPLLVRTFDQQRPSAPSAVVSALDITATIRDYAGVPPLARSDGRSLRPMLAGEADRVRDAAFVEYHRFGKDFSQCEGFFPIRCIVTERWKLAINLFDRDEFYDLASDPHECVNRVDDPEVRGPREELHDRLLAQLDTSRDPLRGTVWEDRPWRPGRRAPFVGLRTTGWKDTWTYGALDS